MSDTLAARLKDLRLKAGLSQYALADRLQENRQRLAAYEQGRFEPPLDLATRWAAACGASLQIVLATTPHELEAALSSEERAVLARWRELSDADKALVRELLNGLGPHASEQLREAAAAVIHLLARSAPSHSARAANDS